MAQSGLREGEITFRVSSPQQVLQLLHPHVRHSTGEDTTHRRDGGNNGAGEAAGEWAGGGGVVFHRRCWHTGRGCKTAAAATILATGMTGGHGASGNVAGIHPEPPSTIVLIESHAC